MDKIEWLMLNYTLPKEPSRIRVGVWRKLKKIGSINLGQSMWILPLTNEHIQLFTDIANDIIHNSGEANIMKTVFIMEDRDRLVIETFNKAREEEYKEFIDKCNDFIQELEQETVNENFSFAEIEENEHEYEKLEDWYKKIAKRDFFQSELSKQSNLALNKCKDMLENFNNNVYERNTER